MYDEILNNYSPVGDVFLFAISIISNVIVRQTFVQNSKRSKIFKMALAVIMCACLSNLMTLHSAKQSCGFFWILMYRDIYHTSLLMLFILFEWYMATILCHEEKGKKRIVITGIIINVLGASLDCLSPITKWGLHIGEDGRWIDPVWAKPYTIFYIINMVYLGLLFVLKKNMVIKKVRNVLFFSQIMCCVFVFVESLYEHNSYTTLTFALPMFVVLIMLHSNPYNVDTGTFGAVAFNDYLHTRYNDNKFDYFMCIKFFCEEGFEIPSKLGCAFYNFYGNFIKDGTMFNPVDGVYILAIKDEKNKSALESIKTLIDDEFPKYYQEFQIKYKTIIFDRIKIENISVFNEMLRFFANSTELNSCKYIFNEEHDKYERHRYIIKQLHDINNKSDLDDPRILVYCQPVLNVEKGIYDSAESLMRMELPEIGMVFPNEFIPIAENELEIHSLSMIILNKTCKAIKQFLEEGKAIERISVNFSVSEMQNPTFLDDFINIVNDNGVPISCIGVEFTESCNDAEFERLVDISSNLRKLGGTVYLDDFGTGYSNFERTLKLGVDVIKFDRSLTVLSDEYDSYRIIIEHLTHAFSELGYKILFEGVETDRQESICKSSHSDYLQGYKYSKPIPIEKLGEFLS